jgi:hypothetical protein
MPSTYVLSSVGAQTLSADAAATATAACAYAAFVFAWSRFSPVDSMQPYATLKHALSLCRFV